MPRLFLCLILLLLGTAARAGASSAAFYYGPDIPWRELELFDLAVIEPAQTDSPPADQVGRVYAYVSLGEVAPSRDYASGIQPEWVLGDNPDWQTRVLDLSKPALRRYLLEQVVAPLWRQGYRHFFFDTLDSYRLGVEGEAALAEQRAGLETLINDIAAAFPGARFILNRGFELMPAVHAHVDAVAAESLYQRWRPDLRRYQEVSAEDRQWLLDRFAEVRERYQLPTIAIDYAAPGDRERARELADRIAAQDVIPWVSNPALDMLGVSRREVMPRRVLMLHDTPPGGPWEQSQLARDLVMPVQHLGLVPDVRYLGAQMPAGTLRGRYAGIITWVNEPERAGARWRAWLAEQAEAGVPVVMLGRLPVVAGEPSARVFGLSRRPEPSASPRVVFQGAGMGFEAPLPGLLQVADAVALDAGRGEPWLTLGAGDQEYTAVAVTDWGGFALNPFVVSSVLPTVNSDETSDRWLLQPLVFLRQALKLPPMPIPDVTTENGRRLLFVHVDGDGFPSLAEVRGYRNQAAGEVLLQEILKRYRIPTTVSVIEGEVARSGLYPRRADELEDIARRIYRLDHVEAATHTYSHPFYWRESLRYPDLAVSPDGTALRLPIADYRLDLERELVGSADYMKRRLLPADKPVKMVLWSGDTEATPAALKMARDNGLLNMNGGDTVITRSAPSWTLIKGLGLPKGDEYQVFAPNQNENLYTNRWQGPFYGYQRVIETFRMTGAPIRFKPIDIYYHTYIASKNASLESLKKVYDWALEQPVHPVFASEYVAKVLDFNRMVVAREGDAWLVRGAGDLRTLRLPEGVAPPALADSQGVAGFRDDAPGPYLHLADGRARWRPGPDQAPGLWEANGRLTGFQRLDDGLLLSLRAHVPLTFTLVQPAGCHLLYQGRRLKPVGQEGTHYVYRSERRELDPLRLECNR